MKNDLVWKLARSQDRTARRDSLPVRRNPDLFETLVEVAGLGVLALTALWAIGAYQVVHAPDSAFGPTGRFYDPNNPGG